MIVAASLSKTFYGTAEQKTTVFLTRLGRTVHEGSGTGRNDLEIWENRPEVARIPRKKALPSRCKRTDQYVGNRPLQALLRPPPGDMPLPRLVGSLRIMPFPRN